MSEEAEQISRINILIDKFLKTQNVNKPEVDIKNITHRGRNYLGSIYSLNISGNGYKKSFIVKCAPEGDIFRTNCSVKQAYQREEYMYKEALPIFIQFQREKFISNLFECIPKFIISDCVEEKKETIILENMCNRGYKEIDQNKTLDYDHVSLIMKEYGKFHALSFAMKDQKPEIFKTLVENTPESFFSNSKGDMTPAYMAQANRALKTLEKGSEAYEIFEDFRNNKIGTLLDVLQQAAKDEYAVIGHGDSKTNNLLFKYDNPEQPNLPTKICILDWQLARYGSPVLDLTHLLCISTGKKIFDNDFDQLLQDYYQSLKSFMATLGSDASVLFPFEVLLDHFKKFTSFGLQMALIVIHLMTLASEDTPDLNVDSDLGEAFVQKATNSSVYETRIRDLILHCVERGFIGK